MNEFKNGDKVKCIDDNFKNITVQHNFPVYGENYTVRETNVLGLILLEEIKNAIQSTGREFAFAPKRFKLVE